MTWSPDKSRTTKCRRWLILLISSKRRIKISPRDRLHSLRENSLHGWERCNQSQKLLSPLKTLLPISRCRRRESAQTVPEVLDHQGLRPSVWKIWKIIPMIQEGNQLNIQDRGHKANQGARLHNTTQLISTRSDHLLTWNREKPPKLRLST